MKLPASLQDKLSWNIVGPMAPSIPSNSYPILAVDGGARFVPNFDVWIGDNDSYLETIDHKNAFFFPTDKDFSDFSLALTLFEDSKNYTLHLFGFLGGRRDHELFNFGEISHHLDRFPCNKAILYSNKTAEFLFFGPGVHTINHSGLISIGTIYPQKLVIDGQLNYTGELDFGALSSLGLSNTASGDFKITSTRSFFIYLGNP